MRSSVCIAAAACAVATLSAQQTFVVPSKGNVSAPGAVWRDAAPQPFVFWGTTGTSTWARSQFLYDVNDIPIPGGFLSGMAVRPPHNTNLQAGGFTTTIKVSVGPNAPGSASSTFANNLGGTVVTVANGTINLPATSAGTWPAPWLPLPFSQTVTYAAGMGPSLVVDFETSASTNGRSWSVEGYTLEGGNTRSELFQSSCRHSGAAASGGWTWSPGTLVVGGSLLWQLNNYPNNVPSLAMNAAFFGISGLGSQVGPFTTPFPLTNLGLPSPPNCQLAIGIIEGFPMSYNSASGSGNRSTLRLPTTPIPNVPAIAGSKVYGQNVAVDTNANTGAQELFPSIAIEFTIGTGATIPATRVFRLGSTPSSSGTVTQSNAATLQFTY